MGMDFVGCVNGEDLGGVGGEDTVIEIYCIKINFQ